MDPPWATRIIVAPALRSASMPRLPLASRIRLLSPLPAATAPLTVSGRLSNSTTSPVPVLVNGPRCAIRLLLPPSEIPPTEEPVSMSAVIIAVVVWLIAPAAVSVRVVPVIVALPDWLIVVPAVSATSVPLIVPPLWLIAPGLEIHQRAADRAAGLADRAGG